MIIFTHFYMGAFQAHQLSAGRGEERSADFPASREEGTSGSSNGSVPRFATWALRVRIAYDG